MTPCGIRLVRLWALRRRQAKPFERADRQLELAAVIDGVGLNKVVLVGHDASGPEAIEFALDGPERVLRLVLLNTYDGQQDGLRLPEMIRLFADPELTPRPTRWSRIRSSACGCHARRAAAGP